MPKFIDLTGQRFGMLTAIKRANVIGDGAKWECVCDCGNTCIVSTRSLRGGAKSCGCLKVRKTHEMSKTRLYQIWINMKQRCGNPNNVHYKNYGNRGVKVCSEWEHDFMAFYNWSLENGYSEELEIDRIDNDEDYSPINCQWITHQKQQLNKRTNRIVEYNGESKTLKEWADELGLDYHRTDIRLLNGWDVERAFFEPNHNPRKKGE